MREEARAKKVSRGQTGDGSRTIKTFGVVLEETRKLFMGEQEGKEIVCGELKRGGKNSKDEGGTNAMQDERKFKGCTINKNEALTEVKEGSTRKKGTQGRRRKK